MPEALAVLLVVFTVGLLYVILRVQSHRAKHDPDAERVRLQERLAWLEERQRHAEQRHWDDEMKRRIAHEIAATRDELVALGRAGGERA